MSARQRLPVELAAPAPLATAPVTGSSNQRDSGQGFDWTAKQTLGQMPDKDAKPVDPRQLYATNLVARFQSGSIVLFHLGYTNTLQIIEPLIKVTRGAGYHIVPLRTGVE